MAVGGLGEAIVRVPGLVEVASDFGFDCVTTRRKYQSLILLLRIHVLHSSELDFLEDLETNLIIDLSWFF